MNNTPTNLKQTPTSFPNNFNAQFEQYHLKQTIPFRDLPLTDHNIF